MYVYANNPYPSRSTSWDRTTSFLIHQIFIFSTWSVVDTTWLVGCCSEEPLIRPSPKKKNVRIIMGLPQRDRRPDRHKSCPSSSRNHCPLYPRAICPDMRGISRDPISKDRIPLIIITSSFSDQNNDNEISELRGASSSVVD